MNILPFPPPQKLPQVAVSIDTAYLAARIASNIYKDKVAAAEILSLLAGAVEAGRESIHIPPRLQQYIKAAQNKDVLTTYFSQRN